MGFSSLFTIHFGGTSRIFGNTHVLNGMTIRTPGRNSRKQAAAIEALKIGPWNHGLLAILCRWGISLKITYCSIVVSTYRYLYIFFLYLKEAFGGLQTFFFSISGGGDGVWARIISACQMQLILLDLGSRRLFSRPAKSEESVILLFRSCLAPLPP